MCQFWDQIKSSDGGVRQLQYTARVEGADKTGSNSKWQTWPDLSTKQLTVPKTR
jgi:hypothetical protein